MNTLLFYGDLLRQLQEKNDLSIDLARQIRDREPGEDVQERVQMLSILHAEIKELCNQLLDVSIPSLEQSKRDIIQSTLIGNCRLNLLINLILREGTP